MSLVLSETGGDFVEGGDPQDDGEDEGYDGEDFVDDDDMTESGSENEEEIQHTVADYKAPASATAIKMGGTQLTYAEAKLYGMLDENGKIKRKQHSKKSPANSEEVKSQINRLSTVKGEHVVDNSEDPDVIECSFAPKKSKQAERAMRNPRCGYDFVSRLQEKGSFLDRTLEASSKGTKKAHLDAQKEDYEARLDKLQCPKCRKYQSFDEHTEKRRYCGGCQERYVKLHVSKGRAWESTQEQNERRRRERLAKIESEAYAQCSFAPKTGGSSRHTSSDNRTNMEERVKLLLIAQKEEAEKKKREREAAEEQQRKKEMMEVAAARARAKERQQRENSMRAEKSVKGGTCRGKDSPVMKHIRPKSAYAKTQGNVSKKFELLINADMESLQNALK